MTSSRLETMLHASPHMSNEMNENKTQFSEEAWDELNVVMEAVREEI